MVLKEELLRQNFGLNPNSLTADCFNPFFNCAIQTILRVLMSKVYHLLKSFLIFCKIYKYFTTLQCYNNNNDNNKNKSFRPAKAPIFYRKMARKPPPPLPPLKNNPYAKWPFFTKKCSN